MFFCRNMLVGFLSFSLGAGTATAAPAWPSAALAAKIDGDVKDVLQRFAVPGADVMVIRNGHISFVRAFGLGDVKHRLPVRPDMFFEIGSITKQFTATSILQLQDAGKLQIDRPLSDYLPDAPHAKEVTLRQLLTHTSGLHDYLDGSLEEIGRYVSRPISYSNLIARIAPLPLDFPPGSRWAYSNTGYLLLGKVIETVSGETYWDYIRHHILDPLHMTRTHTTADEDRLPNMAIGYYHVAGKLEHAPVFDPSWSGAAGFLITTPGDLAKWDAALRGGKIVSMASYRQMTTPSMTSKNGSADYGFGLFVDSVYDQPRIGHTGGSLGFTTADEYFPRQDVRIIAFTNLGDDTPEAGETLTNVVFADLYPAIAARARQPAPGEDPAITQTTRAAILELQGGKSFAHFGARLKGKLAGSRSAYFASLMGSYGAPTAEVFKGVRRDAKGTWNDYVFQFGPGVSLPFSVQIGNEGVVTAFSLG